MYYETCGRLAMGYKAALPPGNSMLNGTLFGAEKGRGKKKNRKRKKKYKKKKNRSWLSKILFLDSTLIDALKLHSLQSRRTGYMSICIYSLA